MLKTEGILMGFTLDDIFGEMGEILADLEIKSEYQGRSIPALRQPTKLLSKQLRVERDGIKYWSVFLETDVTGREDSHPLKSGCKFTSDDGYCFITDDGRSVVRFADIMTSAQLQEAIA